MEADGVVEGFLKSLEMHGLKFNRLIGDGDSSVTKRLHEIQPYGPNFYIKKIECCNHLLRNYITKLTTLARNSKYPLRVRKFILKNIFRFRSDVTKAANHWRHLNGLTISQKMKGIRKDLSNGPFHRLGDHTNCETYFCDSKTNERNLVPEAVGGGIMSEIQNCVSRLIVNAESLLENKDNNICEQFNSLINKHVAGKRINFSSRGNYNTRVEAAVVSFNSKQFLRKLHKKMTNNFSPGKFGKKYLKNHNRIVGNTKRRRALFPETRKFKKTRTDNGPDEDYGLAEPLVDEISPEMFEEKKNQFLVSLKNSNIDEIESNTRDQTNSEAWYRERRLRLTASRFGQICKMRSTTSCKNTVYNILYASEAQSKSLQYGRDMEDIARKEAQKIIGEQIQAIGLIVDPIISYLAASPDGLVGSNAVVEIKCPFVAQNTVSAVDAVEKKLLQYCSLINNKVVLKHDHAYFFQIMGQLHISQREICYFIVYTSNWIHVEKIQYDNHFWETKMAKPLQTFYLECLLPELIDPQFPKRLLKSDIREPVRIQNSIKNQEKKRRYKHIIYIKF
ncbi:unnamed protein product [Macrosiphum euphorbiae]|nr:unnamed protein product [Macrosiphum euphorbiae]